MISNKPWRTSIVLICLLVPEGVRSLSGHAQTDATATLKVQHLPVASDQFEIAHGAQGIYPTALGHREHISLPSLSTISLAKRFGDSNNLGDWGYDLVDNDIPKTFVTQTICSSSAFADRVLVTTKSQPAHTAISRTTKASESVIHDTPAMATSQIFSALSAEPIPLNIKPRGDHPVPKSHVANTTKPIETNKFYAGLFLGGQNGPAFTQPYSVAWASGAGNAQSWGLAVSHIEAKQVVFGPANPEIPGHPASYYINAVGIQSMILSAVELTSSTVLTVENPQAFSANAILQPQNDSQQSITFPLLQGMAFVTGVYSNLELLIQSSVFFNNVASAGSPRPGVFKYRATLEDGTNWLIYVSPDDGKDPKLIHVSNTSLRGPSGFSGVVQVTKNPSGKSGEKLFDNSAGAYAVEANISGSVSADAGRYSLTWTKGGQGADHVPLLMFALPHHVESFDRNTSARVTDIQLRTTTKGNATAVIGEEWNMIEPNLPIDMGFAPWSLSSGSVVNLSAAAQQVIINVAPTELNQNMMEQTNLNSMYFSGKALNKFAMLVYTVNKLGNSPGLASPALEELKSCFAVFVNNKQQFPLVYDTVWKGVVSSAGYNGDVNADFGNTAYNDHHFHYGYFILAAAIIGSLDPSWIPANKDWVNTLVRDAGNPSSHDDYFPFSRMFDWYHGHSWAKGLFVSFDGKDEESTSEDVMFAYAVKMWGKTLGDASTEARGNLMLGIMRHTLKDYFLMEENNQNQPPNFIANRVTGILFENKADHTTYFGNKLEYIEGIHMLPLLPSSAYTRSQPFVTEEWDEYFATGGARPVEDVEGGWKGILYANLALINPGAAWNFFSQGDFDYGWLDGGASRTWYLAFAAGLGGGP